ncbi:MerR family transcriptional regulator [Albimonas sp. CAU 1670]|uniref:MerR family transcriptional regulator n=1 Tax=Albimonas sp. CAU 1670 TaxID=3032599 RepID=UPI0023DBE976|nr:MerR family transcriptional regulator [Albimonas sp. CAU 1670]MDF2233032.1 MerR family transcriptional regulator [Albimonas sp. CAU 1670]
MADIFDDDRIYFAEDPEMGPIGGDDLRLRRGKLARWRYLNCGPAFIRIGRRIGYHGADLNAYLRARRTDPNGEAPK